MSMTKDDFVEMIKKVREVLSSDECKECSCPNTRCELHGDCYNCIRVYRHFGHHVPRCLQHVIENKEKLIKEAVTKTLESRPISPAEYYDHLNNVLPK